MRADVGRTFDFGWEIPVTDNAARRAARDFQRANPGTSYTRALRHVTHTQRYPLTATLGVGLDDHPVRLSLESEAHGGAGPHCLITGPSRSDSSAVLATLAGGLHSGQRRDDLELVVTASGDLDIGVVHRFVGAAEFPSFVNDLLRGRVALLHSVGPGLLGIEDARAAGHRIPTILLIIDSPIAPVRTALQTVLRVGRSNGIHVVLVADIEPAATVHVDVEPREMLVRAYLRGEIEAMFTSVIFALGDGRATLRTPGITPGFWASLAPADHFRDFLIPVKT